MFCALLFDIGKINSVSLCIYNNLSYEKILEKIQARP